jgi:hypothetical protein
MGAFRTPSKLTGWLETEDPGYSPYARASTSKLQR